MATRPRAKPVYFIKHSVSCYIYYVHTISSKPVCCCYMYVYKQFFSCSAEHFKNDVDPVEEYKANFKLSSQLKSETSAHSNKDTSTAEEKLSGIPLSEIPQKMASKLPDSPVASPRKKILDPVEEYKANFKLSSQLKSEISAHSNKDTSTAEEKLSGIPHKMASKLPDSPPASPRKKFSKLPDSPPASPRKKFSKLPDSPAASPRKKFSKFPDSQAETSPLLSMLEPHLYSPEKSTYKLTGDEEQGRKMLTKEQERDVLESTEIIDLLRAKANAKEEARKKKKTINYEESSIPHRQMRSKCVFYVCESGHHAHCKA